jgi:hypothetical protein
MAQDPLSRVASWLTPASADVTDKPPLTSVAVDDPVLALIAEGKRLDALEVAAGIRGDEIFNTLPDDIREGRVRVSFSDNEFGALLRYRRGFTSEAHLHQWVRVHRQCATLVTRFDVEKGRIGAEVLAADEAGYDREVGLDQALAQLRAGQAEIKAIREASGCEAHYREAEDLARRVCEVENQIRNTKPVTLTGAIAMLEWGHENGGCDEDDHLHLNNRVIAGLRDMQPVAARISPGDDRILSLFRTWVDGRRAASAIEDEDEAEKILGPADEADDTIVSIPATGAAGLAVKAYFYLWFEDGWYASDCAALSGRATDETDDKPRVQLKLGLLKDIVAFAPELAPLADRYIKGLPREVYSENIARLAGRAEPVSFGEPEEGGAA